jgi:co-chaperonin GroES (HSP10)
MKLQGTSVLILPDELPEKTRGGLNIPRTATEKPSTGVAVDVGPLCETVSKGDRVQFVRKSASIITIDGKEHYFITENKISYIYE